jgi:hypothetical protein
MSCVSSGVALASNLTTSEQPDLLAAAITDIASRHGVGISSTAH